MVLRVRSFSHFLQGGRAFNFGGGGVDTTLWLDPPLPKKKTTIDGPRKIEH